MDSSYRPRNSGHDYHDRGIYLVTLVVGNRDNLLGQLNMDVKAPGVVLSPTGAMVLDEWEKTAAIQAKKGRRITLRASVCMPNHFHGVIEVEERMGKSLGDIIQYFKSACTSRWRKITGTIVNPSWGRMISNLEKPQRAIAYQQVPRSHRPLFEDNYDDTICLRNADGSYNIRHLSAMVNYVNDNPRRAIIMHTNPSFMQRCLHLVIDGRDYSAFGNLFLLRWARKEQVFCHRKARIYHLTDEERLSHGYSSAFSPDLVTRIPYTETEAFQHEREEWMRKAMEGATAFVTPGISEGEQTMKNECLHRGIPLIHIQKEPITHYWKPEKVRFDACEKGALLILAPWLDTANPSAASLSSVFHNLNDVAREICMFEGTAVVKR